MLTQANNFADNFSQPRSEDFRQSFVPLSMRLVALQLLNIMCLTHFKKKTCKSGVKLFSEAHLF